jgi:hypothetical protein
MGVSCEAEGLVQIAEGGAGRAFHGAVTGCCLGGEGEHGCHCDPLEKAVRGMSAGRSVRPLTPQERGALVHEAELTGVLSKDACTGLKDRDLAVALEAIWDCRLVE